MTKTKENNILTMIGSAAKQFTSSPEGKIIMGYIGVLVVAGVTGMIAKKLLGAENADEIIKSTKATFKKAADIHDEELEKEAV